MKKKVVTMMLCAALAVSAFAGCSKTETPAPDSANEMATPIEQPSEEVTEPVVEEAEQTAKEIKILKNEDAPEGFVYNELSGRLIDASLENQRPIAAMVDNELTALDHYGINDADVIYEMINSTENNRVTRLMVIQKDWGSIERMGSIRSTRTTNCILAAEWNAVLCHDGGPAVFIDEYIKTESIDNISGVFARIDNGKAREFTEYITQTDLQKYLKNSTTISSEYTKYYTGPHFQFTEECALDGNDYLYTKDATKKIVLPFPHNSSELHYNADTNLYEYYEYGNAHKDGATGEVLSVRNVILQKASFGEWGLGYMWYNITGDGEGYYITDGKCVPITWHKDSSLEANTHFLDANGNDIILNAGTTYIGIVPDDTWDSLVIQ